MARNQKNFSFFKYVDDDGNNWNVRGEDGGAFSGVDGHATDLSLPKWGAMSRLRHVRYVVAQDTTTFRTVKGIIYTPTAYAAIAKGDTIAVSVAGLGTTVNYTVTDKIGERNPGAKASRHLADS